MREIDNARLALIPVLAERAPNGHIGRTSLMKYAYFLQCLRNVQLGYDFSLYSYGPFDSEVLADLDTAESLGIVATTPIEFSGGYGYRIQPGSAAQSAKTRARNFLTEHEGDIDWVISTFGALNSAELELASTIVYVDREAAERGRRLQFDEVVIKVGEIKPHFTAGRIRSFVERLSHDGVLTQVA